LHQQNITKRTCGNFTTDSPNFERKFWFFISLTTLDIYQNKLRTKMREEWQNIFFILYSGLLVPWKYTTEISLLTKSGKHTERRLQQNGSTNSKP